ncbi:hypothetical protein SprV_0401473900 [Sparganum proliferum]
MLVRANSLYQLRADPRPVPRRSCVDRFTRWPEAIPLPDVAAPTVVKAFLSRWAVISGVPSTITTDRGSQLGSNLFQSLLTFLGCTLIHTTAYHPAANGIVKRFHRQLKASQRAAEDPENWTDHLPLVLLSISSSLKSDLDCSAAELVFGDTVRLLRQMIAPTPRVAIEGPINLLHRLRRLLQTLSPVPPSHLSPSLISRETWRYTLMSISDVIEFAGPWNHATTAPSELFPWDEELPHPTRNSRGGRDRGPSQSCRHGHSSG